MLLDLPQAIATTAQAQIAAISTAYQARLTNFSTTAYVDQVSGSNNNSGLLASPFATIEKALALTPPGGTCDVYLKSNYTLGANIVVGGKRLFIHSHNETRDVYFDRFIYVGLVPQLRGLRGFRLAGGSVHYIGVRVNVPALDGIYTGYAASSDTLHSTESTSSWLPFSIGLVSASLVLPATPYCRLISGLSEVDLKVFGLTMPGAITDAKGWWSEDQANPAGIAANTLPWLRTNLATV